MREAVKSKIYHPSEGGNGNGNGGGDLAFNGNRPITRNVPGLENVTAGGNTVNEFLENAFFPALSPLCALSVNNPIREIGETTAYTLTWSVTKRTNVITGITVDGAAQTPTGNNQTGTVTGNFAAESGIYTKSMSVTDSQKTENASAIVKYLPRMFWGNINKKTGITDADILALTGSELRENRFKAFTNFGGGGLYPIFIVPVAFGMPAFTVNGLANTDFTVVRPNSPFVNAEGATVMVNVIVFNNFYNSPLNSLAVV